VRPPLHEGLIIKSSAVFDVHNTAFDFILPDFISGFHFLYKPEHKLNDFRVSHIPIHNVECIVKVLGKVNNLITLSRSFAGFWDDVMFRVFPHRSPF
jgi:hypothetical protein